VIAIGREAWILTGFVVLALAAIAVSAAGWILLVRDRRARREPPDDPRTADEPAPSGG
jgi:hypothetical protein